MEPASFLDMEISQFLNKLFQLKASVMLHSTRKTFLKDNAGLKRKLTDTRSIGLYLQVMSFTVIATKVIQITE